MDNATREFWTPERTLPVSIKRRLTKLPLARYAYGRARSVLGRREAATVFENAGDFSRALYRKDDEGVVLRTHDGLNVAIRQNLWDAEIVREIFFEQPYTRNLRLPPDPIVVDVGGYIGDFALYATKYLGARRVVAYEPTDENFAMLEHNVALNGYGDRITAVREAVGDSDEIVLNVEKLDGDEVHVSPYWYPEAEQRVIPSVSLAELFDTHHLDSVDLLKVDCEGGEYDIFASTPDTVLDRVENIAFEYHEIDGYEPKLEHVLNRLSSAGYRLHEEGKIVSAART
ncbi:MAG: FkbM family methyltransferase [Acidimicrobiia bacterium]